MRILLITILFPILSYSQDSSRLLSKYEKFSSETGVMYKTETKDVTKIKDITISIVRTTNLENNQSVMALQIFQKNMMMFTPISLGILYIDLDEIEGVSKALNFYKEQIQKGKPQYQPYFSYLTSNDIQVNCSYFEGSFGGWSVVLSQRYHYLKTTISGSVITIKNKDIDDLADAILRAKSLTF